MRMNERLYLTEDRSIAVKEDDRKGRHLLCKKGAWLDDKIAAKYGIVDGSLSNQPSTVKQIIVPEVKRTKSNVKARVKKGKK